MNKPMSVPIICPLCSGPLSTHTKILTNIKTGTMPRTYHACPKCKVAVVLHHVPGLGLDDLASTPDEIDEFLRAAAKLARAVRTGAVPRRAASLAVGGLIAASMLDGAEVKGDAESILAEHAVMKNRGSS